MISAKTTERDFSLDFCNDGKQVPKDFSPWKSEALGMLLKTSLAAQMGANLEFDGRKEAFLRLVTPKAAR